MKRWRSLSVLVLAVTAVYLYALPSATIFYFASVALHSGLGVLLALTLLVYLFRDLGKNSLVAKFGWLFLAAGAALGIALIFIGHAASPEDVAQRAHRALYHRGGAFGRLRGCRNAAGWA